MKFVACLLAGALLAGGATAQDLRLVEKGRVEQWRIMGVAAYPDGACTARIDGAKIDLIVMFNNLDKIVLMVGHPRWKAMGGDVETSIGFDNAAAKPVHAIGVMTTVTTLLDDDQMAAALKAKSINLTVPEGKFRVNIEHLPEAVAAMKACRKPAP